MSWGKSQHGDVPVGFGVNSSEGSAHLSTVALDKSLDSPFFLRAVGRMAPISGWLEP